jgi:protease IV
MSAALFLFGVLLSQTALDRNPATVTDAYALEANPAGLAFLPHSEMRILSTSNLHDEKKANASFRVALAWPETLTLAASASWLPQEDGQMRFVPGVGAGLRMGTSALGVSWTEALDGDLWRFGYGVRPFDWLSASVSALEFEKAKSMNAIDLGLGIRPWGSDKFTLSTRWRYLESLGIKSDEGRLDIESRIDIEPLDGIYISVSSDLHANVFAEFGLAFDKLSIGSALSLNQKSRHDAWMIDLAIHENPRPNLFTTAKVIVAELSGDLQSDQSFSPFSLLGGHSTDQSPGPLSVFLDSMAESEDIAGLFLKIGRLNIGWAKASELRRSIARLKKNKKRVDCYLFDGSDLGYFVASACDKVMAPPSLILNVDGLTAEASFVSDALADFGIEVDVVAAGKYKSAPEQLAKVGMSPPHREAVTAIIDSLYGALTDAIAQGRKLPPDAIATLIEQGTQTATEALDHKLLDHLAYSDEIETYVRLLYPVPLEFVRPSFARTGMTRPQWGARDRIAVVTIDAQITGGKSNDSPLGRSSGAQTIVRALEIARLDASIRAVVLRVNSPGGDAFASDLIARSVRKLAEAKPVIASFGDVAASGGYYAAAPAHAIYAEATTITGSIGVFSVDISAEALRHRLGIGVEVIQRGSPSQRSSMLLRPNEAERKRAQREVKAIYNQFIKVVADGRGLKPEEVHEIAQGRVWTGEAAVKLRLVDKLGGLADAIRRAKSEAGLPSDQRLEVVQLPRPSSNLLKLLGVNAQTTQIDAFRPLIRAFSQNHWAEILKSNASAMIMAQMPYSLEIR